MDDSSAVLKFKFTEASLESMVGIGHNPRDYLSDTSLGIKLTNFGEEITILGKTKFIAFGEKNQAVTTGIKLIIPDGHYATFLETPDILSTSLIVRPTIFISGPTDEVAVSFLNMGEREVVIPKFATLPVILVAQPFCKNSEVVSDLEYLEATP